ncbi:MAG: DUF3021 domain-containing protein [Clostridia bacterium]|nr:DUF3021 domain-containing protein [Clostridia bacterium]
MNKLKRMTLDFLTIFAVLVVVQTVSYQLLGYQEIPVSFIYYCLLFSLLGTLPGLLFFMGENLSETYIHIQYAIHFILVELLICIVAYVMNFVHTPFQILVLVVDVAIIYVVKRALSFRQDYKLSEDLNEKIKERRMKSLHE